MNPPQMVLRGKFTPATVIEAKAPQGSIKSQQKCWIKSGGTPHFFHICLHGKWSSINIYTWSLLGKWSSTMDHFCMYFPFPTGFQSLHSPCSLANWVHQISPKVRGHVGVVLHLDGVEVDGQAWYPWLPPGKPCSHGPSW